MNCGRQNWVIKRSGCDHLLSAQFTGNSLGAPVERTDDSGQVEAGALAKAVRPTDEGKETRCVGI